MQITFPSKLMSKTFLKSSMLKSLIKLSINYRPEFERLKEDIKSKRINTIIALKLDRITRSIFDWEKLMTFLDENDAYID